MWVAVACEAVYLQSANYVGMAAGGKGAGRWQGRKYLQVLSGQVNLALCLFVFLQKKVTSGKDDLMLLDCINYISCCGDYSIPYDPHQLL